MARRHRTDPPAGPRRRRRTTPASPGHRTAAAARGRRAVALRSLRLRSARPRPSPDPSARSGPGRLDVEAALTAARNAERILAERERQADRDTGRSDDDLMRRREAQAEEEAAARRSAVRQDPAPSRHRLSPDRNDELELEAGH